MARNILSVMVGVILAFVLVAVIETSGHLVFPPPEGMDPSDPESIAAAMEEIPAVALLPVLIAWAVGSFGGAFLAARLAGSSKTTCALIVGVLVMAAGIFNLVAIPHPLWFTVVSLLVFLPAAYLGGRLAAPSYT